MSSTGESSRILSSIYLVSATPLRCPSQTQNRQIATDTSTFAPAKRNFPSRMKLSVCKLKLEKVVYPPQIPTIRKARTSVETSQPLSRAVSVAKRPITGGNVRRF